MRKNKRKLYANVTKYANANRYLKFHAWCDSWMGEKTTLETLKLIIQKKPTEASARQ